MYIWKLSVSLSLKHYLCRSLPCIPKTTGSNENIHFTIFLYFSTDLSLAVCTYSRERLFFDARLHVFSYLIDSSSEAKENKGAFPAKLFVHGNSFYCFRLNREKTKPGFPYTAQSLPAYLSPRIWQLYTICPVSCYMEHEISWSRKS